MIINIFLAVILASAVHAKEFYVPSGGNIQNTIIQAAPGSRVYIQKGFYKESGIIINKPLEIIGLDYPEIDAEGRGEIFIVRSDNVKIKCIKLINSGFSNMKDFAALKIENSRYCRIDSLKLLNNSFGIYLAGSKQCEVTNNEVISNAVSESSSGNGIHCWKCDSILVKGNSVTGHRDGIYFEFVTNSKVLYNFSSMNIRYGLHFMFSNNDDYEYNTFRSNGAGVAVMYTRYVKMINNRFEENWGANAYGLLLKDISDAEIIHNIFTRNTTGFYSEGGTRLNILNNDFSYNGWAGKILGNCLDDTVSLNNFTGNTFDIATNSSRNANLFSDNYWDKYSGYDLNKDGIGDVPFRPVSMFSVVVEETPESIFLLRSFVVDLLDIAEKVVPVFIPETLIDEKPRMTQVVNPERSEGSYNLEKCAK